MSTGRRDGAAPAPAGRDRQLARDRGNPRLGALASACGQVLLALLLCSLPMLASAQTVAVRSGEHATLSRLALDLPGRSSWRIERTAKRATLIVARSGLDFDIAAVFARIPRDRLSAISAPAPGQLVLDLACDCPVEGFWHGDRMLVIDIRDPQGHATADAVGADGTGTPSTPPRGTAPSPPITGPGADATAGARALATRMMIAPWHPRPAAVADAPRVAPDEPPRARAEALDSARDRLLRQIGRAASQGLLTPSPAQPLPARTGAPAAPHASPGAGARSAGNLRAETSIDREILRHLRGDSATPDGTDCLPPERVDVAGWAPSAAFPRALAERRGRLLGEFDRPDQTEVLALARLYLHFGFGLEARKVLALAEAGIPDLDLMLALADIVDQRMPVHPSALPRQLSCETPVAFWAALATAHLPRDQPIATDSILRGFDALPEHLRRHLGPDLAQRFTAAGFPAVADQVLRIIDRAGSATPPQADLVRAELELAEGQGARAEARLEDLARSTAPAAAHAVLRRINLRIEARQPVTLADAELAAAHALEQRGTDLGHALGLAYLTALAVSGAFDQAYDELRRLGQDLPPETRVAARHAVLAHLTRRADTLQFLRYVLADRHGPATALPPDIANAAARRLLSEGFADQALALLAGPDPGEARRLLRAEIALVQNRPRQAQVELLGLTGPDATRLGARAQDLIGDHDAAAALYRSGGALDEAARQAWLAEDWEALSGEDDPVLAALARHLRQQAGSTAPAPQPETGIPNEGPGVLAQGRDLLREGAELRGLMEQFLATQAATVAPDATLPN